MKAEIRILNRDVNATVVQLPERKFPGMVFQGDTLKSWQQVAAEILEALANGDLARGRSACEYLRDSLNARLAIYENVLTENGISLPY